MVLFLNESKFGIGLSLLYLGVALEFPCFKFFENF